MIKDKGVKIKVEREGKLTVGKDVYVGRFCFFSIYKGGELIIGNNVHFSQGVIISCSKKIEIGDDTIIGHYSFIGDGEHTNNPLWRLGELYSEPIKIKNNVWIGNKATILKGSVIEDDTVIGANTVVSRKHIRKGEVYYGR